ncbi:MAG: hypothetical protein RSE41_03355 [Clostridia bacterium]
MKEFYTNINEYKNSLNHNLSNLYNDNKANDKLEKINNDKYYDCKYKSLVQISNNFLNAFISNNFMIKPYETNNLSYFYNCSNKNVSYTSIKYILEESDSNFYEINGNILNIYLSGKTVNYIKNLIKNVSRDNNYIIKATFNNILVDAALNTEFLH